MLYLFSESISKDSLINGRQFVLMTDLNESHMKSLSERDLGKCILRKKSLSEFIFY